jgi:hypothetical protein
MNVSDNFAIRCDNTGIHWRTHPDYWREYSHVCIDEFATCVDFDCGFSGIIEIEVDSAFSSELARIETRSIAMLALQSSVVKSVQRR